MIVTENILSFPDTYPIDRLDTLEDLLFFDIETTGFSGDYSSLYLIGCIFLQNGSWRLKQWFADRADSEPELLKAFFEFLKPFKTLIHFNGEHFDIPFLLKRCHALGLPYDFDGLASVDIYKRIRPYRKLLGLEHIKQKSLEQFLGLHRRDPYTGGQLIDVYKQYLITGRQTLLDMLMLHNQEDLEGMLLILPVLSYPDFLEHDFQLTDSRVEPADKNPGRQMPHLHLTVESFYEIPVPFCCFGAFGRIEAQGSHLYLDISLFEGALKFFYPDYQNYYYLIYEDMAVHKSIGEYVEKSARQKAAAQTCYTRKNGLFLPQPSTVWEPVFKKEYKDKTSFVEYTPRLWEAPERLNRYIRELMAGAGVPVAGVRHRR